MGAGGIRLVLDLAAMGVRQPLRVLWHPQLNTIIHLCTCGWVLGWLDVNATAIGTGKPDWVLGFRRTLEMAGCITPGVKFRRCATHERCRHLVKTKPRNLYHP